MAFVEPDAYFELHPTRVVQCRPRPDGVVPTGALLLHTSEGAMDVVGEDTGTLKLARYLVGATRKASYHDVADSDDWMHLVDWDWMAWHDGTGSNPYTTSISFVCRTVDWARMSPARRRGFLTQGALAFVAQQEWRRARGYPLTRVRLISSREVSEGKSGVCYHGWRDPGRRTDPGTTPAAPFPVGEFFAIVRDMLPAWHPDSLAPSEPINEEDDMFEVNDRARAARIENGIAALIGVAERPIEEGRKTRAALGAQTSTIVAALHEQTAAIQDLAAAIRGDKEAPTPEE